MSNTLVEVCVGSVEDAQAAQLAGADRLELCAATEVGGLTPSAGLIEAVTEQVDLPVMVMIRPRPGGFCYGEPEFDTAVRDLKLALQYDITGVVFGFLGRDGQIDADRSSQFVTLADGRETVFHRAFDVVPNPEEALDALIQSGVTRLLTSGQRPTAAQGANLIQQLIERANGNIQILPGGGIRADSVAEVVRFTGCNQVHVGASAVGYDQSIASDSEISFHAPGYLEQSRHRIVDRDSVAAVLRELGR